MTSRGQDITAVLKKQIEEFGGETTLTEVGTVVEVGDGIAQIYGLSRVGFGELLSFPSGVSGLALNLKKTLSVQRLWARILMLKKGI